jgi:hypothetical protein
VQARTLVPPSRDLSASRWLVEAMIGRTLRKAEQAIDVLRLDQALAHAKDDLEAAIRAEMVRATKAWLEGPDFRPELELTQEMTKILERLEAIGAEEAELELERLGYRGIRRRALVARGPVGRDVSEYLRGNLGSIGVRIHGELVAAEFGDASSVAIAHALMAVPGARDLASRAISTALINGLGMTFEENRGLVKLWVYTAVLDGGTCEVCAPLDGSEYETLEALFQVLPDFGPNPDCLGGGRCRCRAVPADAREVGQQDPVTAGLTQAAELPEWQSELLAIRDGLGVLDDLRIENRGGRSGAELQRARPDLFESRGPVVSGEMAPGPALQAAEQDVLRAGEILNRQIDERAGDKMLDLRTRAASTQGQIADARVGYTQAEETYRRAIREADAAEKAMVERLRAEIGAANPELDLFEVFRAAREREEFLRLKADNTARLLELQREKQRLLEPIGEARRRLQGLQEEVIATQRQTLLDLLSEIREVGFGDEGGWAYTTGGRASQAKKILDEAGRFYPREWIETGRTNALEARWRKNGRGYHSGGNPSSEIVVSGGRRSKVGSDPDGLATAIHELAHHLEHTDPRFKALEWAFYQRRTRAFGYGEQEREIPLGAGYGRRERYRADAFTERYMGKTYGNGATSSYELLTMALESIWTGSYELDPEMTRWILGLLATL